MPKSKLFPLRLAPFEEFFFYDDRPGYPATFLCKVTLKGSLNLEAAQLAANQAARRHPLATTRIKLDSEGRPWFHQDDTEPAIRVIGKPWETERFQSLFLDPTREGPIRLWLFTTDEQSELVFQFHHAVFDGMGGTQFFNDWLAFYRSEISRGTHQVKLPRLDPQKLIERCRPDVSLGQFLRRLPGQWLSFRGVFRFQSRKPIPLVEQNAVVEPASEVERPSLGGCSRNLSSKATDRIREHAVRNKATVNSLLACDLFLAISQWQRMHGENPAGTHLRLTIPINERTIRHRRLPGCNHCTMINIDRTREELTDQSALLNGIQDQMDCILKWNLSLNMWRFLRLLRALPGGIESRLTKGECRSTCVLTNLGNHSQRTRGAKKAGVSGNPGVSVCGFMPMVPIRPGTACAFAVFYLEGSLNISVRYDPKFMTNQSACHLLELLIGNLTSRE